MRPLNMKAEDVRDAAKALMAKCESVIDEYHEASKGEKFFQYDPPVTEFIELVKEMNEFSFMRNNDLGGKE